MKFLRQQLDKAAKLFEKGGKLESQYPLFEAADTFLYTPGIVTKGKGGSHVRDAIDQKRMMITVFLALIPCVLFALYNTGLQANAAIAAGAPPLDDWRTSLMTAMGLGFDPTSLAACVVHGLLYFLPVYLVTLIVYTLLAQKTPDALAHTGAFFAFRGFDVLKIQPAKWLEGLPGAWGIMCDDQMAGLYAGVSLWLTLPLVAG